MIIKQICFVTILAFVANLAFAQGETRSGLSSPNVRLTDTGKSKEALLNKFQKAHEGHNKRNRSLPLTSISIEKDCSADVTCPNGTILECSIKGPRTSCNSSPAGVGCFKENSDGSVTGSTGDC